MRKRSGLKGMHWQGIDDNHCPEISAKGGVKRTPLAMNQAD